MEIKKKRGEPRQKGESGNKEWEDDEIFVLIDAWSGIEQLFHCKHPKYHLRDENMKSLENIKGFLHENGIEVTVKQITDKIHSLRNYYSAERRKEEAASKKSGSGQDDLYTSKWLFFQPLSFLRNNVIPRVTETNLKRTQVETTQNPREGKISRPVFRKMSIQEKNNAINRVAESIESIADKISAQNESLLPPETTKSKSEDEIFGEMIFKMVSGVPECEEKYLLK